MAENIFSEFWHQIAPLRLSLIPSVKIHKQYFNDESFYVIKEPHNNKYFKIRPELYKFLTKLTTQKTIESIWEEYLELEPDLCPSQDEIIKILSQLHQYNLLYFKDMPDNELIFNRYKKTKSKEKQMKFISFMYLKIPLWDPEQFLQKTQNLTELLFNKYMFILWCIVLLFGLKEISGSFNEIYSDSQGILAPSNLIYLYLCMGVLKFFHEMGHAMMVKKFGGDVHTLGLMFVVFTPLPYMDASSSWWFKNKYERILVGSAGMLVELFFAAIAAIIWANTGDGLIHNLAFNIMVIGSVSSILFNGNPLLKFDSYYMLSDYLEMPNLYTKSKLIWYYWIQKYIYRLEDLTPPVYTTKEKTIYATYNLLSLFYRLFVAVVIILFVADQWFEIGVLVFILTFFIWVVKPMYELLKYLYSDGTLYKKRKQIVFITSSFFAFVFVLFVFVKFPYSIYAKGVIDSNQKDNIFVKSEGILEKINIEDGVYVKKGEIIAVLSNKTLLLEKQEMLNKLIEIKNLQLKSNVSDIAISLSLQQQIELYEKNLANIDTKIEDLIIRAKSDGVWISNNLYQYKNSFLKMKMQLGRIVPQDKFTFVAVVPQEEASELFKYTIKDAEVKFYGIAQKTMNLNNINVIPYEKNQLPSAALGWNGGGDFQIDNRDESGLKTTEAFFELSGELSSQYVEHQFFNRRGVIKIDLDDKSLYERAVNYLQQLVQKRYKL
jgi:putative peptide zinc metalloprotease protein